MDFSSIMAAAQSNSANAKYQKELVLKTKLSAPKKAEKKKVDVEALKRRRAEEEKRLKEEEKRLKEEEMRAKAPPPAKPVNMLKKSTAEMKVKPKSIDKPKYENKEHEMKHKQFMNKMQSISNKAESKSNNKIRPAAKPLETKKKLSIAKKPKPTVNPPSFHDLMKMAEKVKTDPSSLTSPSFPTNNHMHKKNESINHSKHHSSDEKLKETKPSSDKNLEKQKVLNGKVSKHKHSTKPSATGTDSALSLDKRKESHSIHKKERFAENTSSKPKETCKRPYEGRGDRPAVQPAKKPMLSESAMAKLALKEGRKPTPKAAGPGKDIKKNSVNEKTQKVDAVTKDKPKPQHPTPKDSKTSAQVKNTEHSGMSTWDQIKAKSWSSKEKVKKKPSHRFIDSDDEDEDLEGFIVDGEDEDAIDYSAAISSIFGYDKSRYHDEDFDDRTMVAGFADIMKEEVRSTKLGLKEDLEDMEMEEREKKKKMAKKKKKFQ